MNIVDLISKVENQYVSIKDCIISKSAILKVKLIALYATFKDFVMTHLKLCVYLLIGLIILLSLPIHHSKVKSVIAENAPIVKDEPKINVVTKTPIKVYKHSKKIKQKVNLPNAVIQDENKEVVSVSKVEETPSTVTTILDVNTGDVTNYVQPQEKPFISFNKHGDVGLYTGIKNGQTAMRLMVKQGIVDIKSIHIEAIGSIDQTFNGDTSYFTGIGASYSW